MYDVFRVIYIFVYNQHQQLNVIIHYINKGGLVNFHTNAEVVVIIIYIYLLLILYISIASLPFYLLCQFLKSEADIIEVTVMEVFREEKISQTV